MYDVVFGVVDLEEQDVWCGGSGGARCMVWWIWRSKICGVVHDVVDQEEHDVPFSRS